MRLLITLLLLVLLLSNKLLIAQDTIKRPLQKNLSELKINSQESGTTIRLRTTINEEKLGLTELKKNACCNLAESFESSPTVEVGYSNPVTGTKQIQMLGLAGTYVQIMYDQLPGVRSLNQWFGMEQIPATFIEAIYVNKGPGSVANGFESMSGQIDVELIKPEKSARLLINAYANSFNRQELNIHKSFKLSQRWFSLLEAHASRFEYKKEFYQGFVRTPQTRQYSLINRWKYNSYRRIESMFGIKANGQLRWGGQSTLYPILTKINPSIYAFGMNANKFDAFNKTSFRLNDCGSHGIGLQIQYSFQTQTGFFGQRYYNGQDQSFYLNAIHQYEFEGTGHSFKDGLSLLAQNYLEGFSSPQQNYEQRIQETIPGAFFEYSYVAPNEKWSLLVGQRIDHQSRIKKWIYTPRFHIRFSPLPNQSVRFSAGTGFKSKFLLAENPGVLNTTRRLVQLDPSLLPEQCQNYGFNYSYKWKGDNLFNIDYFYTYFTNQIVIDMDFSPYETLVYNLKGNSYSKALQVETYLKIIPNLFVRLAYKNTDVRWMQRGEMKQVMLVPKHRALFNIAYSSKNEKWKFDFTTQWVGKQRLPHYEGLSNMPSIPNYSPNYFRHLGQVTFINKDWEYYIGGENLSNFKQENILLYLNDTSGNYFDANYSWGPVTGRLIYTGIRWTMH